jgi:hypothetical protein
MLQVIFAIKGPEITSIGVTGTRGSKNKLVRISFFHASEFNFRSMTCMRLICDLILVN